MAWGNAQPTPEEISADLMRASEQITPMVEFYNGLRQKFVDLGWTPHGAEEAALELIRTTIPRLTR